jgi:hypothetical protein
VDPSARNLNVCFLAQLTSDIREYREGILRELMTGAPVETVFAPQFKPFDTVKPLRRAA